MAWRSNLQEADCERRIVFIGVRLSRSRKEQMMYLKNNGDKGWEVRVTYHDFTGKKKQAHKRGFKTKREAVAWGNETLEKQQSSLDISFTAFWDIYKKDMAHRLRENTMRSKDYIVELKLLPYFGKKKMLDITASDVRQWQTEMIKQGYSQTYLKTINNQLSAIFNYAQRYYDLPRNPARQAGSMGKGKAEEMNFWTQEEFESFLEAVNDKPVSKYAFLVLYWTGMRIGELLALTVSDFDSEEKTLRIDKSYQRIKGRDIITDPKTKKGKRTIALPDFLVQELQEYIGKLYGIMGGDRLFQITKSYLEHEMERGIKESGVKKIRLHDLRHSHASLLISKLGASPQLVADRLGHEKIETTLNTYAHLYPDQGRNLADQLDTLNVEDQEEYNWK